MDIDGNGVSCNVHPFPVSSKQKVKQMQIYLVVKAGLIVSLQKTAAQEVLEASIKKNFDKLVENGRFTSVEKENLQKASPGAKQPMAAHSIWRKFKEDKRFLLNYMFPHYKVSSGENEADGLERVREATFQYLASKKKDEKAAKKAKKGSAEPPSVTPTSSEEEDIEYGDKMPQNWFCPHLLCFKMFHDDPVLKPNDAPCSANPESSSDEDKLKKVEGKKEILSRRQQREKEKHEKKEEHEKVKAAAGDEVNAKVLKEQCLAVESGQLHTLRQEHMAIKWVELAAATGDSAFKAKAIQFASLLFEEKMDEIEKKKKASEAVREEEVQQHKRKAKVAVDVDKENAADSADGEAVEIAHDDDSESDDSECKDSDDDDDNDGDKCCAGDYCCYTLGNWKAAKDHSSKCFKCSGMCHDICCKLIGRNIKFCVKCEEEHKAQV